jgi:hypothetical protein
VLEVVSTLAGIEAFQELADSTFKPFDGSLGGGPQERLEFGERQFDGIEVGTVGRQIDELGAYAFDRFADAGHFVSGQIIHHDEVARLERRRQLLLDVAEKHRPVHRAVDDGGGREASQPQRADEGRRLPVAVRDVADDALTAKGPAVQPSELRMGPAFVEKRQPPYVEMRLPEPPSLTAVGHVWTQLLSRMNNFF